MHRILGALPSDLARPSLPRSGSNLTPLSIALGVFKTLVAFTMLASQFGCGGFELSRIVFPRLEPEAAAPVTDPVGVISIIAEPAPADGGLSTLDARSGTKVGAGVGALGGAAVGLAACAPTLLVPWAYAGCALIGSVVGMAGGSVAGAVAGDVASRTRVVNVVLSDLPSRQALAEGLHSEVMERAHSISGLAIVDLGAVPVSLKSERLRATPTRRTLSLQIKEIRGQWLVDGVNISQFHVAVEVHTERDAGSGGEATLKRDYGYKGEPISSSATHPDLVAAAERTVRAAFKEIARNIVVDQLTGAGSESP